MVCALLLLRHVKMLKDSFTSSQEASKELCLDAIRAMSEQHCTDTMHAALSMMLERFADAPDLVCSLVHLLLSSANKVGILSSSPLSRSSSFD